MSKDHVSFYISYPPRLSVSEIMKYLKGGHRTNYNQNSRISRDSDFQLLSRLWTFSP